jgi:hypothetical protein
MIIVLITPSMKPWWVMTIWNESAVLDDQRQFTRIFWCRQHGPPSLKYKKNFD